MNECKLILLAKFRRCVASNKTKMFIHSFIFEQSYLVNIVL